MTLSAFPYIGGKTHFAGWIIEHLPDHEVYVEPFGGSAAVLLNKPRSEVEAFNDIDGDIVQFFEVVRDRADELAEWVRAVPYSERLYNEWADAFYAGERPDDPIERAGRFIFLRYSQFAGKYHDKCGFKRDVKSSWVTYSRTWAGVDARIRQLRDRLRGVCILDRDYQRVLDEYDDRDTVFYLDPPYVDKGHYYNSHGFSHADLFDSLEGIEGRAIVSYTKRPAGLYEEWVERTRSVSHTAGTRKGEKPKQATERLFLNFDPETEPRFVHSKQQTLGDAIEDSSMGEGL